MPQSGQGKKQSQHQTDKPQSRAAANSFNPKQTTGVSLQPPAQLKLAPGRSYFAIQAEDYYLTQIDLAPTGQTAVDGLYSAMEHDAVTNRTKLKQHSDEKKIWVQTRPDVDDPSYYRILDPELAIVTTKGFEQDDPQELLKEKISMKYFPSLTTMPSSPRPEDAQQGDIGDCTLISAMGGTVNSPHYRKKFKDNYDDTGPKKQVDIFDPVKAEKRKSIPDMKKFVPEQSKKKTKQTVETAFPYLPGSQNITHPGKDQLLYAQSDPQVLENLTTGTPQPLWPAVVESAMAQQLGGNIGKLDNRQGEEMASMLTGVQSVLYEPKDFIPRWDEIKDILANEGIVLATTKKKFPSSSTLRNTLIKDHEYYADSLTATELKLKDPHGKIVTVPKANVQDHFIKFAVTIKV